MSEISLPGLLDVVQPNGAKICPIMGSQIFMMPINPGGSVLTPQQPQQAFVRHSMPCVGPSCQLWDVKGGDCKIGLAADAVFNRMTGLKVDL